MNFQGYRIFCIQYHLILILTSCCVNVTLQFEVSIVIAFALVKLLRLLFLIWAYKLLVLLNIIVGHVRVIRLIHRQCLVWLIL